MLLLPLALLGVGGSAGWTPARLFAASEVGAWYDPSDISTLWQDTAGTTPVTATGQAVARIDDKSGNGKHATQATGANCPLWQQDGSGNYYLDFDGTNDYMTASSFDLSSTDKLTIFAGVRKSDGTGTNDYGAFASLATWNSAGTFILSGKTNQNGTYYCGSTGSLPKDIATTSGAYPSPQIAVVRMRADISGDSLTLHINGVSAGSNTGDQGTGNYANSSLRIGSYTGSGNYYIGRIYSLIVRGATSTTQEITDAEAWVNDKTGAY